MMSPGHFTVRPYGDMPGYEGAGPDRVRRRVQASNVERPLARGFPFSSRAEFHRGFHARGERDAAHES